MSEVFFSYAEEDTTIVRLLSRELWTAGFRTWMYEREGKPGFSYLREIEQAMREATVVILIISPASILSKHVTNEMSVAFEDGKPVIPVLHHITHPEFQAQRGDWRLALGTAISVPLREERLGEAVSPIVKSLNGLRVPRRATGEWTGQREALPRPDAATLASAATVASAATGTTASTPVRPMPLVGSSPPAAPRDPSLVATQPMVPTVALAVSQRERLLWIIVAIAAFYVYDSLTWLVEIFTELGDVAVGYRFVSFLGAAARGTLAALIAWKSFREARTDGVLTVEIGRLIRAFGIACLGVAVLLFLTQWLTAGSTFVVAFLGLLRSFFTPSALAFSGALGLLAHYVFTRRGVL